MFFALMSIYGWINWSRGKGEDQTVKISRCSAKELAINSGILVISFFILRILLKKYTNSPIPTWDAITTAFYIVAMWLLAIKKIENWIAWILGDSISIFLYAIPYTNDQVNYFSSFQFLVFTIIAVLGFMEWKKKLMVEEARSLAEE
jgi:nicotinamide mononucleotide transporter